MATITSCAGRSLRSPPLRPMVKRPAGTGTMTGQSGQSWKPGPLAERVADGLIAACGGTASASCVGCGGVGALRCSLGCCRLGGSLAGAEATSAAALGAAVAGAARAGVDGGSAAATGTLPSRARASAANGLCGNSGRKARSSSAPAVGPRRRQSASSRLTCAGSPGPDHLHHDHTLGLAAAPVLDREGEPARHAGWRALGIEGEVVQLRSAQPVAGLDRHLATPQLAVLRHRPDPHRERIAVLVVRPRQGDLVGDGAEHGLAGDDGRMVRGHDGDRHAALGLAAAAVAHLVVEAAGLADAGRHRGGSWPP